MVHVFGSWKKIDLDYSCHVINYLLSVPSVWHLNNCRDETKLKKQLAALVKWCLHSALFSLSCDAEFLATANEITTVCSQISWIQQSHLRKKKSLLLAEIPNLDHHLCAELRAKSVLILRFVPDQHRGVKINSWEGVMFTVSLKWSYKRRCCIYRHLIETKKDHIWRPGLFSAHVSPLSHHLEFKSFFNPQHAELQKYGCLLSIAHLKKCFKLKGPYQGHMLSRSTPEAVKFYCELVKNSKTCHYFL